MPRIDPLKLLSCLKVLLAPNGGIRSANEVKRLAELMLKYSKKLVSKCIYIQILKCTNTDLLEKFMGAGGWGLTHIWLNDGIRTMNWPLVQEILELLLLCPVDVQRLRSNTAPKLVKALCKDGGNEGVRILATKLVEQWLKIVKGETMATASLTRNNSNIAATPTDNNEVVDNNATATQTQTAISTINKSTCHTSNNLISPSNALIIDSNHAAHIPTETIKDQDPLAIPNNITASGGDESLSKKVNMNCSSPTNSSDSTLVYKIVIKDGKQILAKVEQNQLTAGVDIKDKQDSEFKDNVETKSSSNEIQEVKEKEKETDSKDIKDSKENDKEKRDRDRSRDHKSSSSHRKSSSSSKSSSKSGRSSSPSSSSKSKHSSSSSSHRSSKDGSSSSSSKSKDRDKERSSDKDRKSSKSSSSSSSSKDRSKDRDRDRDRERHKSKDKDKDGKDKDNEKDKEDKEKAVQAEKDKDTLSKVLPPSIDKLGKIPRKPKEENDSSSSSSNKASPITTTSITIPSKKASMSIEVRRDIENRPKTVKTYNSQFRSHGLAEEAPPPPSRKGLKKPISQSIPGTTIMSSITLKRTSPPPNSLSISSSTSPPPSTGSTSSISKDSQPQEKKIKIDLNPSTNSNEKPGAIKLIAPKPKRKFFFDNIFNFFFLVISERNHSLLYIKYVSCFWLSGKDSNNSNGLNTQIFRC